MVKITKEELLAKDAWSDEELAGLSVGAVSALLGAGKVTSRRLVTYFIIMTSLPLPRQILNGGHCSTGDVKFLSRPP